MTWLDVSQKIRIYGLGAGVRAAVEFRRDPGGAACGSRRSSRCYEPHEPGVAGRGRRNHEAPGVRGGASSGTRLAASDHDLRTRPVVRTGEAENFTCLDPAHRPARENRKDTLASGFQVDAGSADLDIADEPSVQRCRSGAMRILGDRNLIVGDLAGCSDIPLRRSSVHRHGRTRFPARALGLLDSRAPAQRGGEHARARHQLGPKGCKS